VRKATYKRAYDLVFAALVLSLAVPYASFATQREFAASVQEFAHDFVLPSIQPDAQSSCTVEAVAYAAALTKLTDAQRAANEAYRRWYECEYRGETPAESLTPAQSGASILLRD
jgi:hypothetical protein